MERSVQMESKQGKEEFLCVCAKYACGVNAHIHTLKGRIQIPERSEGAKTL